MSMSRAVVFLAMTACAPLGPQHELRTPPPSTHSESEPTSPTRPTEGEEEDAGTDTTDCPPGVICVDALPYVHTYTSVGGTSTLDGYSCAPETDESGPEVVYRVELQDDGLLTTSLSGLGDTVDVDVHILEALDPDTCIDRGHWDAASLLPAGTYYVVVDTWVDGTDVPLEGAYTLDMVLTTADRFQAEGLHPDVLGSALLAFDRAWSWGETWRLEYGIIDYTLPSTTPRFFVLDLRRGTLLHAVLVSHGSGSQDAGDLTLAADLSNTHDSHASSMGLVRCAETYDGGHGRSMRLDGLEPGFNDNDRSRAIVVHGADYATQDFVDSYGYLGRSWGCPAVDPEITDAILDSLSDGALLLKYWDDPQWLAGSAYL